MSVALKMTMLVDHHDSKLLHENRARGDSGVMSANDIRSGCQKFQGKFSKSRRAAADANLILSVSSSTSTKQFHK